MYLLFAQIRKVATIFVPVYFTSMHVHFVTVLRTVCMTFRINRTGEKPTDLRI